MYYHIQFIKESVASSDNRYIVKLSTEHTLISSLPGSVLTYKQGSNSLLLSEYSSDKLRVYYTYTTGIRGNTEIVLESYQRVLQYIKQVLAQNISSKDLVSLVSLVSTWNQL